MNLKNVGSFALLLAVIMFGGCNYNATTIIGDNSKVDIDQQQLQSREAEQEDSTKDSLVERFGEEVIALSAVVTMIIGFFRKKVFGRLKRARSTVEETKTESASAIENDPLGRNEESFRMAKQLLLEARKHGESFFGLFLCEISTRYFFTEQQQAQFYYCAANKGAQALSRLSNAGLIDAERCVVDNLEALLKRLNPPVAMCLLPKRAVLSTVYTITPKGLDYCEKHCNDLVAEPTGK